MDDGLHDLKEVVLAVGYIVTILSGDICNLLVICVLRCKADSLVAGAEGLQEGCLHALHCVIDIHRDILAVTVVRWAWESGVVVVNHTFALTADLPVIVANTAAYIVI